MRKATILCIILLLVTTVALWSQNSGNLLNNSAEFWNEMNNDGKVLYVQGILAGTFAVYEELRRNDEEVASRLDNLMPWGIRIGEIVEIINGTYRKPENHHIPIWYLVINVKEAAEKLSSNEGVYR